MTIMVKLMRNYAANFAAYAANGIWALLTVEGQKSILIRLS